MTRSFAVRLTVALTAGLGACASPPTFETLPASIRSYDDGHVFWQGAFKRIDYQKFLDRGLAPDQIRDFRVRNSPGGELSVVTRLRALVASHDFPLRVQGQCASGCAMIYVASANHHLLDDLGAQRTYLHFHGTYDPRTGTLLEKFDDRELLDLARTTRGRFPPSLYRQARTVADPRGGLYVYKYTYDGEDGSPSVFLCTGQETSIPRRCQALPLTAVGLGLDD